jgi:ubiquinone/menaquinone biosynthesis C-methylase UbiE
VGRTQRQTRDTYDRRSSRYDLLAGWAERPARRVGLSLLAASEGETILELGFGTGQALVDLARAVGPRGRVHGLDLSDGMLEVAKRRLWRSGVAGSCELRLGDALALPYQRGAFDAVFMSFVLEIFNPPEIPIVLGEGHRVLREGGRLVVVALSRETGTSPLAGLAVRLYEWLHDRFPEGLDCRPIDAEAAVSQAGFNLTRSRRLSLWGLPVEVVSARR